MLFFDRMWLNHFYILHSKTKLYWFSCISFHCRACQKLMNVTSSGPHLLNLLRNNSNQRCLSSSLIDVYSEWFERNLHGDLQCRTNKPFDLQNVFYKVESKSGCSIILLNEKLFIYSFYVQIWGKLAPKHAFIWINKTASTYLA